jgi:hypothetical protein
MPKPPGRQTQFWTEEEIAELRRMAGEGIPTPAIAKALGRTQEAVTRRANALQLPLSSRGRKPADPQS